MHFAKFIGLRIWYPGDKICTVITLREIHKSFGAVDVLRGVDWTIPRGARIGLIGLNGSGKSTLLLIIKGDLEPDSGEVLRPPGLKIGYLPQEPDLTATDFSVLEESLKGREDLLLMEKRIRQLEDEMKEARGEKLDILIEEHSRLHQEFLKSGGYALKSEALKVLKEYDYETRSWKIQIFGDSAIATFIIRYRGQIRDLKFDIQSRVSAFLLKRNEEWKIVHEHWSRFPL